MLCSTVEVFSNSNIEVSTTVQFVFLTVIEVESIVRGTEVATVKFALRPLG
jgi:hypothetical protein